jgi:hypothetical protein
LTKNGNKKALVIIKGQGNNIFLDTINIPIPETKKLCSYINLIYVAIIIRYFYSLKEGVEYH